MGHKDCPREIAFPLLTAIEKLITADGVTRFYVGTHGGFDRLVYRVLCELEKKYTDIQVFVVPAYLNRTPQDNDYDMQKLQAADEDIRSLKCQLLVGIRDMAALALDAAARGCRDRCVEAFFYKALIVIGMDDYGVEDLLPIVAEMEQMNLRCMEMADGGKSGPLG